MNEATDLTAMALACIEAISRTLLIEQRNFELPDFNLDPFQTKLIDTEMPFVRVVAPAGSGKTRTLTAKALNILKQDHSARILCLAFTNPAVDEFRDRIRKSPLATGDSLKVSTVNAFGWEIVRRAIPRAQIVESAKPLWKARSIIKEVLESFPKLAASCQPYKLHENVLEFSDIIMGLGFSDKFTREQADPIYNVVRDLRLMPLIVGQLKQLGLGDMPTDSAFFDLWFPFWKELTAALRTAELVTLEAQKYWAYQMLASDSTPHSRLARYQFTHVMVDEFQDINFLDLSFVSAIARLSSAKLYTVGDDDQCIFEWRGCTSHFMCYPESFLPLLGNSSNSVETIILEQNYRCPRNIVQHASSLIQNNYRRIQKRIVAVRQDDANIRVVQLPAAYLTLHVVDELISTIAQKYPDHQFALILRKQLYSFIERMRCVAQEIFSDLTSFEFVNWFLEYLIE